MKFFLLTYGCTLNQSDSDIIRAVMLDNGAKETKSESSSDVVIVNSCGVKNATEQKIMDKLRKLAGEKKPTVLAGCLAANEKLIAKNNPVASIIGTSAIHHVFEASKSAIAKKRSVFLSREDKEELPRFQKGIIAKIPIAEGCSSFCSFCFTRIARGKLKSYSIKWVKNELEKAVRAGAKEIQLTAQDTGAYGKDLGAGTDLPTLLRELVKVEGTFFIRLGMINPEHAKGMQRELIDVFASSKIYKFIHLPVQSGSDPVLKSMKRGHNTKDFEQVAKAFKKRFPDLTLSTDIIVGFPTETEKDFEKTLSLLRRIRPDVCNLSKFTPRPFTPAALMKQLPNLEVKRRSEVAAELCKKIAEENNKQFVGKSYTILVTEKQRTLTGRNISYRQVALPDRAKARIGETLRLKITGAGRSCLFGEKTQG